MCPKTKKIHIQICVIVNKPIELEHWKKLMFDICSNHVHCQVRKHGNSEAAKDYCMKDTGVDGDRLEGTNPFIYGEFRYAECAKGQGERTDASAVYSWMKENVGNSFHAAMDAWEGTPSFHFLVSNRKWYSETMLHLEQVKLKAEIVQEHAELSLYPWQKDVLSIVSLSAGPPDPRLIDVVVDQCGGRGKSLLTSLLSTSHGFISLGLGKRDDLVHAFVTAYQNTSDVRGVIIDTPMSAVQSGIDSRVSIWQTAEMLKNRSVTSNKYASATFFLPRLHVVIMTNQPVPFDAFGANRLRIHHLEDSTLGIVRRVEMR